MKMGINCQRSMQKLTTKMVAGQIHENYHERLHELGTSSYGILRVCGGLAETFIIAKGLSGTKHTKLFTFIPDMVPGVLILRPQRNHTRHPMRVGLFTSGAILLRSGKPEEIATTNDGGRFK